MAYYVVSDGTLSSIADAIRYKGSTSASMAFPDGFISGIYGISGGGEGVKAFIEQSYPDRQVIDNTASYVGSRAFYQRPVTYVSLGAVTEIRSEGFYYCTTLESVCCPECTFIDVGAFTYCSSLKRVTSDSFPKCTSMRSLAFNYLRDLEILELPALQSIVSYTDENFYGAFQSCYKLSYVDIGSLSFVPRSWFASCSSLVEVHATNLTEIKYCAFHNCDALSSIDITNVSVFESYALYNCALSGHITLDPATHTYGTACFTGNKFTTASYIGYSIVPSLLRSNSLLYSVDVGSATELAAYAFDGCIALSSLSFVITSAGSYALQKTGFSRVPSNTLSSTPTGFMEYCNELEELTPSDFSYSDYTASFAFYGCSKLSRVEMSGRYVQQNAFGACSSLKSVSMPNVSTIYDYAFRVCGLEYAEFPKLVSICRSAFYSCSLLSEIRIGMGTTSRVSISSYAFQGCANLVSLYIYGGSALGSVAYVYSLGQAFANCPIWSEVGGKIGNVYVPSQYLNAYKTTAPWNTISSRIFAIPDEEL